MPLDINKLSDEEVLSLFGGGSTENSVRVVSPSTPAQRSITDLPDEEFLNTFSKPKNSDVQKKEPVLEMPAYSDIPVPHDIPLEVGAQAGAGLARGARDVGEGIGKLELAALNKIGLIGDEAYNDTRQLMANRLNAYDKSYGDNRLSGAWRGIGQTVTSLPLMMAGGELAGAGAGALAKAVPSLQPAVSFLSGASNGNKLLQYASKGISGAEQGGAAMALTSGGSNEDIGSQVWRGMLFGGPLGVAAPVITDAAVGGYNYLSRLGAPFTTAGRERIANEIIHNFAGAELTPNAKEIVHGSMPTLAEATASPGIASLQDTLRDLHSAPFAERMAANAEARSNALTRAAGTPQDIESAIADRSDYARKLLGKPEEGIKGELFSQTAPVNASPVTEKIDSILSGTSGKRPAVVKSMNDVKSMLSDAEGNLESNPETLYHSIRKGIGDLMDKKDLSNPAGKQAAAQLLAVQGTLDDVIEQGAPGFKKYLSEYSAASKPIDAMEWLQGLNIKDSKGNITLSKVQNALTNVDKLQGASGINKAKSLSDEQIDVLRSIRDDLLRQDNLNLGKSFGSPTVQKGSAQNKLQSQLPGKEGLFSGKLDPELMGAVLGQGIGATVGLPGTGTFLGGMGAKMIKNAYNAKSQLIRNRLTDIVLNPELYTAPVVNGNGSMIRMLQDAVPNNVLIPTSVIGINNLRDSRRRVVQDALKAK